MSRMFRGEAVHLQSVLSLSGRSSKTKPREHLGGVMLPHVRPRYISSLFFRFTSDLWFLQRDLKFTVDPTNHSLWTSHMTTYIVLGVSQVRCCLNVHFLPSHCDWMVCVCVYIYIYIYAHTTYIRVYVCAPPHKRTIAPEHRDTHTVKMF